ncbi:MAG TPA: hypothetical protein VFO34_10850 [Candidatus Acidoferrales bacterium]|nr:hypothetical protein [Candidatus Acidoferrales bacterium]
MIQTSDGHKIRSFSVHLRSGNSDELCSSILSLAWVNEHIIATECHINPSLSEYVETDVRTGKSGRDLLGFDFKPAPDASTVAHVGWIIHFARPPEQSYYLQFDEKIVYPLPRGKKPFKQRHLDRGPLVVTKKGDTYTGIHEFAPGFSWSPDSKHLAFIDCTFDWTSDDEASQSPIGERSYQSCSLIVIDRNGKYSQFPDSCRDVETYQNSSIQWTAANSLVLYAHGILRKITIR